MYSDISMISQLTKIIKNHKKYKSFILFAFLSLSALCGLKAEAQTDSLYLNLDSATFVSEKHTSAIKLMDKGTMAVDMKLIQSLPKILGNTDPVGFIRNLPGVQTCSEYDSGIHVNGCDNSHNFISLGGAPVFGANHLFGFFSVFNPSHYSKMEFSSSSNSANRLGGTLTMNLPDTLEKKFSGDINVGIMSSQGTIGARIGKKSHLRISARQSYMNLLYKRWLKIEGSPIKYGFGDYNLTWLFLSGNDKIWADAYWGHDNADISEKNFSLNLKAKWGNLVGALHWMHDGNKVNHKHSVFYSGYRSDAGIVQGESNMSLNSFINTAGYIGKGTWKGLEFGGNVNFYYTMPQNPVAEGLYGIENASEAETQTGLETSLYAGYSHTVFDRLGIAARLKADCFYGFEKKPFWGLSPDVSVTYNAYRGGKVSLSYRLGRQYLFQTGLSNIGLPMEFWFLAGKYSKPQWSHDIDLSYKGSFFRDALAISASVYYKQLYNQVEYCGDLLDFFTTVYDLDNHLLKGRGWNYGLNLMVHKQNGRLTGWISYSLGRALRQFNTPEYAGIYPANHERIHELNAVCSYKINKWDFSGTFVYASGAPFTAPESYYISSGQILTVFGEHNACRMRPYIRLDLSVTYNIIRTEKHENGINVSLYNALARENDVMYRVRSENGKYSYRPMSFFLKLVPSVSYYHKF